MNRRQLLSGVGTLGVVSIAGCGERSGDPEQVSESEADSGEEEPVEEEPAEEEPVEEEPAEEEPAEEEIKLEYLHGITGFTWPPDIGGKHSHRYEWAAVGYDWWYEMDLPRSLGRYYANRYSRSRNYGTYITDAYGEPYISNFTDEFERLANEYGLNERETVNLVIRFVQQMEYTPDDVSTGFDQHSQYPVETLIEQGGDCEDSAILLSAFLSQMGYGCVLLYMPDTEPEAHMALGVKGDSSLPGTYYEYNGDRYYYVEGTDEYAVGQMPDWDGSTNARFIPVRSKYPTLVYGYATEVTNSNEIAVDVEITNQGGADARNTSFHAGFEDENERVYGDSSMVGTIESDESKKERIYLSPPDDKKFRLLTSVKIDGNIHDKTRSEWQYPLN
ncbi:hypothetical protein [Halalkalirubrum salinum]|uniref:hypothetical protein n=1 Tax=Halalkalirubrum salinum TaxID=2563889 RepID=UPI001484CEB2|nr:hypothetical protein [Halalkalirubrum salinum]